MFPGTTDLRSSLKSNPHVAVSFSFLGVLVVPRFSMMVYARLNRNLLELQDHIRELPG